MTVVNKSDNFRKMMAFKEIMEEWFLEDMYTKITYGHKKLSLMFVLFYLFHLLYLLFNA